MSDSVLALLGSSQTMERYTQARSFLENRPKETLDPKVLKWVSMLSQVAHAERAHAQLVQLPVDQRRQAAISGLEHPDWRVRRRCAQILDDLAVTEESEYKLKELLDDEHPKVRQAALHTLVCEACKPEECNLEIRPIAEAKLTDSNADVRRQAAGALGKFTDERGLAVLRQISLTDQSVKVRTAAEEALDLFERQQAAISAWLSLPEELQAKVAKHTGKWVAVAEGRVVTAGRHSGQIRRDLRGKNHPNALICWVPPKDSKEGSLVAT